jgi:hypothetical protein
MRYRTFFVLLISLAAPLTFLAKESPSRTCNPKP